MGHSKKSSVQKYHDRVAPRYDNSYDDDFWKWHDALTWDYIKPHLPKNHNASVLDLGCGTGKWGAKLIKSGFAVTFVDISGRMIDQARKKINALDTSDRAQFLQTDLCDLSELPKNSFSLAIAMGDVVGCTHSPKKALKQIHRSLTEDGVLIATLDNRLSALDFYLDKGDPATMKKFLRDGKTHWLTRDVDERFDIFTYTPDEASRLIESCGYDVLEIIGKTILPMRHYRPLLESSQHRRAWANIEKTLCRNRSAIARASHIQITARKCSS